MGSLVALIVILVIVITPVIIVRKKLREKLLAEKLLAEKLLAEKLLAEKSHKEWLLAKYGDEEAVDKIIAKKPWPGETSEQLRDSLGAPIDTARTVTKMKTKEVWKYNQLGKRQFGLRITIEDGKVISFDEK
jgi:hypothetical protein